MKRSLFYSLLFAFSINHLPSSSQDLEYNAPGTGNPLVPGYFADPTVKKFGDYYYIYATTDGVRLASGEPQVWISKDFVNWYNQEINLPFNYTNVWAPDVIQGFDGKYYYFHGNCENGCNVYGYVSDSPLGPWESINSNKALITPNTLSSLPALDQNYFIDDDSTLYVYYGTWIYRFKGLGWLKVDTSNMKTILEKGNIPNAQLPDVFEAPYMLKRNGKYIIMYSSGDCKLSSYRVQYAYSDSPTGPFTYGENNPILETNISGTVDGPGHHSVLKEGDSYYIVYHRHNNPHSGGGMFRQLCVDSLVFLNDTTIQKVVPTNKGIGYLGPNQEPDTNYAYLASASATSSYHLVNGSDDYIYSPSNATDNNNGTLWKAGSNTLPQSIVLDLGQNINVKRITTQFEYATYYYQYKIEYSADSLTWQLFADKTSNKESGCPKIDDGDVNARYIKVTITGTEKTGMFAAIWNIKVYSQQFAIPEITPEVSTQGPGVASTNSLLVELSAKNLPLGDIASTVANTGSLGGNFVKKSNPVVQNYFNVQSIHFDGNDYFKLDTKAPLSLSWNSSFTVSAWVLNPEVAAGECIVVWSKRTDNLAGEYAALMYGTNTEYGAAAHWDLLDMPYNTVPEKNKWHHLALTFDGMLEKIYVDGILNNQEQKSLFIHPNCDIMIGFSGEATEYLKGSIASLRMYDKYYPSDSIQFLMDMDEIDPDYTIPPPTAIKEDFQPENISIFYSNENECLTLKKNNNKVNIEKVDIVDMTGRLVATFTEGLNQDEIRLKVPEVNLFVAVIMSNTSVHSKLIYR